MLAKLGEYHKPADMPIIDNDANIPLALTNSYLTMTLLSCRTWFFLGLISIWPTSISPPMRPRLDPAFSPINLTGQVSQVSTAMKNVCLILSYLLPTMVVLEVLVASIFPRVTEHPCDPVQQQAI